MQALAVLVMVMIDGVVCQIDAVEII